MVFTLPLSNKVFIFISPPQEQKNFCVLLVVRAFLLAAAITNSYFSAAHPPQAVDYKWRNRPVIFAPY
jgi:hypothetical protein